MKNYIVILLVSLFPMTSLCLEGINVEFAKGDEISGDAMVSWSAIVEKVTVRPDQPARIKANFRFSGRTMKGYKIRGRGKMRFLESGTHGITQGDILESQGLLEYLGTVTNFLGKDLLSISGVGLLDTPTDPNIPLSRAMIELKAAIDIEIEE